MKQTLFTLLGALSSAGLQAHEGHGMPGALHWHPGDVLPWLGAAAALLAALWWARRR